MTGGDIYRMLRRTIELLRSVAAVPYVSATVKRRAAAALAAMNRYPVADNTLGLGGAAVEGEEGAEAEAEEGAQSELGGF